MWQSKVAICCTLLLLLSVIQPIFKPADANVGAAIKVAQKVAPMLVKFKGGAAEAGGLVFKKTGDGALQVATKEGRVLKSNLPITEVFKVKSMHVIPTEKGILISTEKPTSLSKVKHLGAMAEKASTKTREISQTTIATTGAGSAITALLSPSVTQKFGEDHGRYRINLVKDVEECKELYKNNDAKLIACYEGILRQQTKK